jgi:outer membrane protein TolC
MSSILLRARLGVLLAVAACVHRPPHIEGGPGAPAQPNVYWTPPPSVTRAAERDRGTTTRISTSLASLDAVIDLALRNNPVTRLSWAQARAAADVYGASRGSWFPTLSLDATATRSRSLAVPGRPAGERTQYGPSIGLSYLVLDFGGRAGNIDAARQTAIAMDLSHNAAVQNTILAVELALFNYLASRALRDAERVAVDEATASLNSAEERRRVGLATVADVLQARTARSQAQLALESLEGAVQVAHGGLAVAMGLPPTATFEVPRLTAAPPIDSIQCVTESVDSLIATATRARPDLAAARAQAAAAAAEVRVARSALLPAISLNANSGYSASNVSTFQGRTYTLSLGFDLPLFSGFSRDYALANASEQLEAANARTDASRQQIALQVFTAYYTLQTATERVRTAADLLASATESESVARGRYREGVGSIVDLLIAQSALADARAQDAQARWQWRGALAQLAHDVGTLGLHGEIR